MGRRDLVGAGGGKSLVSSLGPRQIPDGAARTQAEKEGCVETERLGKEGCSLLLLLLLCPVQCMP